MEENEDGDGKHAGSSMLHLGRNKGINANSTITPQGGPHTPASDQSLTITELENYHQEFLAITSFLIGKNRISESERNHVFVRGFPPESWSRISQCLQLKQPDHYPDDLYSVNDVYEATNSAPAIKSEDILLLIESLVKSVQMLTAAATGGIVKQNGSQAVTVSRPPVTNGSPSGFCHYCGEAGGMIRTCKHIEEDIKSSKCLCNAARKVVLPNGTFVPRTIPGITIHDHIYEWHRCNQTPVAASVSAANLFEVSEDKASSFSLGAEDRIEALEQELFNLKQSRPVFNGSEKASEQAQPQAEPEKATESAPSTSVPAVMDAVPEHPFRLTRDVLYIPPNTRNFGQAPKPGARDEAYRNAPPVYQSELATTVFERSMKSSAVTLSMEELLSISPDVRNKYHEACTLKHVVPPSVTGMATIFENAEDSSATIGQEEEFTCRGEPLAVTGSIIPDPYDTYLKHIPNGDEPEQLTVAKGSHALQSIVTLINNKERVQAILDPGC
ncbi:uncharacterized protein LAESUDRAFT_755772 [Laetiporus sulphureus 93-53]|uniref:CCHC-type domain-containing protein n=1 Tax=Laetiporus sulphureus 93-53 TaxID=1314785 RepID=A0A165GFA1_9APHY|nr:uncharacterized protein LAESUDRAFT_755772 [Laetiporus sulphureus 93-53]KZT10268.1 hypothetical protein LAESUDRAFT_755772 [Laetiporus sulphureus 93-53]